MNRSKPFYINGQGLVSPGHVESPREAREAAETWLKERGMEPFYAALHTETAPVELAWMSGGDFVQEHHEEAEPVTVVMVPPPPREEA